MLKYCYCSSEMVRTYKKCKRLMLFKQTLHPGKNLVPVWWQPVKFSQSDFFLQTEGAPHQPSSPDSPGVARRISSRLGWGDCERRRSPFRERTITSFGSKQATFFFFFCDFFSTWDLQRVTRWCFESGCSAAPCSPVLRPRLALWRRCSHPPSAVKLWLCPPAPGPLSSAGAWTALPEYTKPPWTHLIAGFLPEWQRSPQRTQSSIKMYSLITV